MAWARRPHCSNKFLNLRLLNGTFLTSLGQACHFGSTESCWLASSLGRLFARFEGQIDIWNSPLGIPKGVHVRKFLLCAPCGCIYVSGASQKCISVASASQRWGSHEQPAGQFDICHPVGECATVVLQQSFQGQFKHCTFYTCSVEEFGHNAELDTKPVHNFCCKKPWTFTIHYLKTLSHWRPNRGLSAEVRCVLRACVLARRRVVANEEPVDWPCG